MIIKCKMCGGELRPNENAGTCAYKYYAGAYAHRIINVKHENMKGNLFRG